MSNILYTSIIGCRVHPGREADFMAAFEACGMLRRPRAIAGFVSGQLLQQHDDSTRFTVVALWRTPEAYAEWGRKSQAGVEEESLRSLSDCLAELTPGKLFGPIS